MSDEQTDPQPRPDNMIFVQIPLSQIPRETDELSFVLRASPIDYGINF